MYVCVCVADGCSSESKDVSVSLAVWQLICLTPNASAAALINIAARAMALLPSLLHDSETDHETITSAALLLSYQNVGHMGF